MPELDTRTIYNILINLNTIELHINYIAHLTVKYRVWTNFFSWDRSQLLPDNKNCRGLIHRAPAWRRAPRSRAGSWRRSTSSSTSSARRRWRRRRSVRRTEEIYQGWYQRLYSTKVILISDVRKIFRHFDPIPQTPSAYLSLNPRNLLYVVCFVFIPPLGADVIQALPLMWDATHAESLSRVAQQDATLT